MNCERCQTELEDFLYGESSERLAAEMRAHLADCAECIALRDDLALEHELFAQFYERTAVEPTADTWEVIRARIAAEPARQIQPESSESKANWWQSLMGGLLTPAVLRQAALALLLIALSVVATIVLMKRGNDGKNIVQQGSKQEVTPLLPAPSPTTSPAPLPTGNVAQVETPAKSSPSN
ncbi:MAG: zf-HC2 domain-containing protein, partial [Blastocatellia bacterium]